MYGISKLTLNSFLIIHSKYFQNMSLSIGADEILVINLGDFKTTDDLNALKTLLKRHSEVKKTQNCHKIAFEWSQNGQVDRRLVRTKVTIAPDNVQQFQKLTQMSMSKENKMASGKSLEDREEIRKSVLEFIRHHCEEKIFEHEKSLSHIEGKILELEKEKEQIKILIVQEKRFLGELIIVLEEVEEEMHLIEKMETPAHSSSLKTNPGDSD